MILLDKPYVSDFLIKMAVEEHIPVLESTESKRVFNDWQAAAGEKISSPLLESQEVVKRMKAAPDMRLYTNSENTIAWISHNLEFTDYPRTIGVFKDKLRFRKMMRKLYPDYAFHGVSFDELDTVDPSTLPMPCVLKPSVGFYSLGVHMVQSEAVWQQTVQRVKAEVGHIRTMYPEQVLKVDHFIIEECIEGEEYAVDAYFDEKGEPVILNVLVHLFASAEDVSDRVYMTSATLIETWHDKFTDALRKLGKVSGAKNFPVHAEMRVNANGDIHFIEVNPMRFAGWCLTEIARYAYGVNPYSYYLENKKPDWQTLLAASRGKVFSIVIADVPPNISTTDITHVNYEAFIKRFSRVHEVRCIDYTEYPVFAMLMVEVPEDDLSELHAVLTADLGEYITVK